MAFMRKSRTRTEALPTPSPPKPDPMPVLPYYGGPTVRALNVVVPVDNGITDLVGLQMEVTNYLLEASSRKLISLQKQFNEHPVSICSPFREVQLMQKQEIRNEIKKTLYDCQQLETEYEHSAMSIFARTRRQFGGASRSQPLIGMKHASKDRKSLALAQSLSLAKAFAMSRIKSFDCNNDNTLTYEDGNLVSGSIDALIRHLVPTTKYCPERTYRFAFLLGSRLFIESYTLLCQVWQICIHQQNLSVHNKNDDSLKPFVQYLIQLLMEWTDVFSNDFRDDRLMKQLRKITSKLLLIDPSIKPDYNVLVSNLSAKHHSLKIYEDLLFRINSEVANRLNSGFPTTEIFEVCECPLTFAEQLTHIELERLSMIGPEEFVDSFKNSKCSAEQHTSNNLNYYTQWFNRLSFFVSTEICMHLKKKNRVRAIEYFIDVAKECLNIGNFNSVMAILGGLNNSSVSRLKRTWSKINKDKFDILEQQMSPSANFSSYRSSLKAALWRSELANQERERIVIPFFSLFVKDLYFINQGFDSKNDTGNINFEKLWQLAKSITEFMMWKQVQCPFQKHPAILNYVLTNPVFSENSLALASYECEEPVSSYEKNRFKELNEMTM